MIHASIGFHSAAVGLTTPTSCAGVPFLALAGRAPGRSRSRIAWTIT